MIQEIFEEEDIPIAEFENIGLSKDGQINLGADDLRALFSGGRTDLVRLQNLEDGDIRIMNLDAKLSLRRNEQGGLDLLIHPVYRNVAPTEYVTDEEAGKLSSGEQSVLNKTVEIGGKKKEVLIEFDQDTREFVITDSEQVLAPDLVNNEALTPGEKARFKKGHEVALEDGTKLRFSATAAQGIRSNRLHLILSMLMDGGLSFILYKGLKALSKEEPKVSEDYSKGYYHALEDMKVRQVKDRMKGNYVQSR